MHVRALLPKPSDRQASRSHASVADLLSAIPTVPDKVDVRFKRLLTTYDIRTVDSQDSKPQWMFRKPLQIAY